MYTCACFALAGTLEKRSALVSLRMRADRWGEENNVHLLCMVCGSRCGDSQPVGGVVCCGRSVHTAPVFALRVSLEQILSVRATNVRTDVSGISAMLCRRCAGCGGCGATQTVRTVASVACLYTPVVRGTLADCSVYPH